MDLVMFHKLRVGIQGNAFPSSGRELEAIEKRLRASLNAASCLCEVEVEQTDNPDQLVIGLCKFGPDQDENVIAELLQQIWREDVAYPFWEVSSILVDEAAVELEGATRTAAQGPYVTVHVAALNNSLPAQRLPAD